MSVIVAFTGAGAFAASKPWDAKKRELLTGRLVNETRAIQDNLAADLNPDDKTSPQFVVVQAVHTIHIRAISLQRAISADRPRAEIGAVFRRLKVEVDLARKRRQALRDAVAFFEKNPPAQPQAKAPAFAH